MAYFSKPTTWLTNIEMPEWALGQAVHPSVVDMFIDHGETSWAGYRYWMAFTPYTNSNDRYENPCLVASHDGITWIKPPEITNPLTLGKIGFTNTYGEPTTYSHGASFNADPCLRYEPLANELWLFWNAGMFKIPETLVVGERIAVAAGGVMSREFLRDPATGYWHCWDVWLDGGVIKLNHNFTTDPAAVSGWGTFTPCSMDWCSAMNGWGGKAKWYPWHVEARYNRRRDKIEMAVSVQPYSDGSSAGIAQAMAETTFANPTTVTQPIGALLLDPAVNAGTSWDKSLIYKASLIEGDTPTTRRLWYSAAGVDGDDWHIGYAEGVLPLADNAPAHAYDFDILLTADPVADYAFDVLLLADVVADGFVKIAALKSAPTPTLQPSTKQTAAVSGTHHTASVHAIRQTASIR